jgi:hypothetical protein
MPRRDRSRRGSGAAAGTHAEVKEAASEASGVSAQSKFFTPKTK